MYRLEKDCERKNSAGDHFSTFNRHSSLPIILPQMDFANEQIGRFWKPYNMLQMDFLSPGMNGRLILLLLLILLITDALTCSLWY